MKSEIIKFKPILKQTLWGGGKIARLKGIDTDIDNIGESWEISGVDGSESVVNGGEYDGMAISEVIKVTGASLVGKANFKRFGTEFPLLIKLIDANKDLSIQVHPDDEAACRQGRKRGKTEMWFIMKSEPYAKLRSGLCRKITPEQYAGMVNNNTICDAISQYDVKDGDCFFIPAGRIHSIGAGCFLTEIQQTSDVTYRIYDFNRRDANGNLRELHTQQAAECIDYNVLDDYRTHYAPAVNKEVCLVDSPFFTTSLVEVNSSITLDHSDIDSFVVMIALEGSATISTPQGCETTIKAGETILVPAVADKIGINGNIKVLESWIV